MSIASEITRLQNDSSAISSAISAKGVTVPSGSGFDDYANLIGQISGGGSSHVTTTYASGSSTTVQTFTGLLGEPISFSVQCGPIDASDGSYLSLGTNRTVTSVIYDGTAV